MHTLLSLLKQLKTNETCILTGDDGEPYAVLLSYQHYQNLAEKATQNSQTVPLFSTTQKSNTGVRNATPSPLKGLTSNELLDRINREIAQWKDNQNPLELDGDYFFDDRDDDGEKEKEDDENTFYLENVEE